MSKEHTDPQANTTGDGNVIGHGNKVQSVIAKDGSTISNVTQVIAEKYHARSQAEELSEYLKHAIAAYEARMYQHLAPRATPLGQPYKFLYAFEIEDVDIFFGRDAASEALRQAILKERLTVLHAKSGAGKTSLLNAGLSPRLIREGRLPVYARAYEDPVRTIKQAIAPPSLGPWPELLPQLTMHEFLGLACTHLSRQTKELVVILDQFEEFFIFWPERDHRQPFIHILADCYDDKSLPVRFIVGIRGDYFTHLATFQDCLPHIFHNEYYLEGMTREEAQSAITGPLAKLGRPVTCEPALLDELLDDLFRGRPVARAAEGMELLPSLQIICTRLYEALAEGDTAISLASYEELGRAEGVLSGYLNDVLDRLPGRGGHIAREVLKELVSSESTKRVLSYDTLAARIEAEEDELDNVLAQLVNARLLRRDEVSGEITYEMAHEYLIGEIEEWLDQSDLAFKQAEELLVREVANWRVHGTLIPKDRLELLYAHRDQLRGLDDETWECLLRSALQADFVVQVWAKLAGEVSKRLLLAALDDQCGEIRRAATYFLGVIRGLPEVSRLGDKDPEVRRDAARTLGETGDLPAVELLTAALRDENSGVRQAAATTLRDFSDPRVLELLVASLQDEDPGVRQEAARALRESGDSCAVEPLVAALQDGDPGVRREAVRALRDFGDPRALDLLVAALQDEDPSVRREAVVDLGDLGDPRAAEPLVSALWDKGISVCRATLRSLGTIWGLREVSGLGDENSDIRREAARALGDSGDPRAAKVLEALWWNVDENRSVREEVAKALEKIRGHPPKTPW